MTTQHLISSLPVSDNLPRRGRIGGSHALVLVTICLLMRVHAQTYQSAGLGLGLPRLKDQTADGSAPVAKGKFTEDALTIQGMDGAHNGEKRGAKFLTLDGKKELSRPLRGAAKDTLFVSFSIYGSPGTIIDVGGAKLAVVESIIPGCAQLMAMNSAGEWQSTGFNMPFDFHDKKILALMPVITVRLDPADGTFDLYQSARLLAEDLPLQPDKGGRKLTLTAGLDGAQINGLVQSDENPLYPDANGNGVDDRFEQQKMGHLLVAGDSRAARKYLIAEWRVAQRTNPAPALLVNLPLPDGD